MKVKKIFLCSVLAISTFSLNSNSLSFALAQEDQQIKLVIEQNRLYNKVEELKDKSSQEEEYGECLSDLIENLQQQIDGLHGQEISCREEVAEKNYSISLAQEKIDKSLENLKVRLRAVYMAGGDTAFLKLILDSSNMKDLFNTTDVVQIIGRHDSRMLEELKSEMTVLQKDKDDFEKKEIEIKDILKELEEKRQKVKQLQEDNQAVLEKIAKKKEEEKKAKERAEKEAKLVCVQSTNGKNIWPVPSCRKIVSPFGGKRKHKGIDICQSGVYGSAIVAVRDGVVKKSNNSSQWGSGWGYHVMIDHGGNYCTQYAHCSSVLVSVGQRVKAGQVIGYVGNTGHSNGAHLHFETWQNGVRHDPMRDF